jgi:hypothetical protein
MHALTSLPPLRMSSARGTQRKSKAKVPKPPRGSGLNPSGELAANQLRIPTEQPQMSFFRFDPHAASGGWQQGNDDVDNSGWSLGGASFMDTLDDQFNQGYDPNTLSSDVPAQHPLLDSPIRDPHTTTSTSSHRIMVPSQHPLLDSPIRDPHATASTSSHRITVPSQYPLLDSPILDPHATASTSSHQIMVPSQQHLLDNTVRDSHGISVPPYNDTLQNMRSSTSADMSMIQLGEIPDTDVMHVCLFIFFSSFDTDITD